MGYITQPDSLDERDQSINPSQAEFDRLIQLNAGSIAFHKENGIRADQHLSTNAPGFQITAIIQKNN